MIGFGPWRSRDSTGGGGEKRPCCKRCSPWSCANACMVVLAVLGIVAVGTVVLAYYSTGGSATVNDTGEPQRLQQGSSVAPMDDDPAAPHVIDLLSQRDVDGPSVGDGHGNGTSDSGDGTEDPDSEGFANTTGTAEPDSNNGSSSPFPTKEIESTTTLAAKIEPKTTTVPRWPNMGTEAPLPKQLTLRPLNSPSDNKWLEIEPYEYPDYMRKAYRTEANSWTFVGYRYAHPVTWEKALQPPMGVDGIGKDRIPWPILDGTLFGTICAQPASAESNWLLDNTRVNMSSDCLLYNVYMPFDPKVERPPKPKPAGTHPVYVHIHGGHNSHGSSAELGRHGVVQQLLHRNVLVVTFNYRLGWLGWLDSGGGYEPAQRGLLDVETALDWVRRNVGAFGGDPNRITVGGDGTGACLASLVAIKEMRKPSEKMLFQLILMSGSASTCLTSSVYQVDPAVGDATKVFLNSLCPEVELDQNGVPTSADAVANCIKGHLDRKELASLTAQNLVSFDWWGVRLPDGEYRSLADAYAELAAKQDSYKKLRIFAGVAVDAWSPHNKAIRNHPRFFSAAHFNQRSATTDDMTEIFEFLYAKLQASEPLIDLLNDAYLDAYPSISQEQIYFKSMRDLHITAPQLGDLQRLMELGHTVYLYDFEYKGFFHEQLRTNYSNAYSAEVAYFLMPEQLWERVLFATDQGITVDVDKEIKAAATLRDTFVAFIRDGTPIVPDGSGGGKKLEAVPKASYNNAPYLLINEQGQAAQKKWSRDAAHEGGLAPMALINATFKGLRKFFYLPSYNIAGF